MKHETPTVLSTNKHFTCTYPVQNHKTQLQSVHHGYKDAHVNNGHMTLVSQRQTGSTKLQIMLSPMKKYNKLFLPLKRCLWSCGCGFLVYVLMKLRSNKHKGITTRIVDFKSNCQEFRN